jgi:hypothetical protein
MLGNDYWSTLSVGWCNVVYKETIFWIRFRRRPEAQLNLTQRQWGRIVGRTFWVINVIGR